MRPAKSIVSFEMLSVERPSQTEIPRDALNKAALTLETLWDAFIRAPFSKNPSATKNLLMTIFFESPFPKRPSHHNSSSSFPGRLTWAVSNNLQLGHKRILQLHGFLSKLILSHLRRFSYPLYSPSKIAFQLYHKIQILTYG